MGRRGKRSKSIDFGARKISGCGIVSSCLFGAETVVFLGAVYYAYLKQGAGGILLGAAGFLILAMSAAGAVLGGYGLMREEYGHGADLLGLAGNTAVLVGICFLFWRGTL